MEAQDDQRGIQIAGFADFRIDPSRRPCIHFFHLAANEEARHVEVVDGHVEKHAAGNVRM